MGSLPAIIVRSATASEAADARQLRLTERDDWAWWQRPADLQLALQGTEIIGMAWEAPIPGALGLHVIEGVWVREGHRGHRLGLQLVESVFAASEQSVIWLDCRPSLVPYYESAGFRRIDRALVTPDYLSEADPPDQAAMARHGRVEGDGTR